MALSRAWQVAIGSFFVILIGSPFLVIDLIDSGVIEAPHQLKTISHYVVLGFKPILSFIGPIQFGTFLKVWKMQPWPQKKLWMFITGCWALSALMRVYGNAEQIYQGRTKCGGVKLCGIGECTAAWTEVIGFLTVVLCSCMGLKWDGGMVDKWLEQMVKIDAEQRRKLKSENIENAEKGLADRAVESEVQVFVDERAA